MMKPCAESVSERQDKQLRKISLPAVLEKRRLDQALNAKEFAVCAGTSYSTARNWFRLPGFPSFGGVVLWQDFVQWRTGQNGLQPSSLNPPQHNGGEIVNACHLPPHAAQILLAA